MKARVIKTGEIVEVYHEPQHGQITNIYKEAVLVNGRMWDENELDFNCIIKANKAPEKIYIDDPTGEFDDHWSIYQNNDSIEYTRIDAFIKKAVSYLNSKLYDWVQTTNPNQRSYANTIMKQDFIEDFVNYMKGE